MDQSVGNKGNMNIRMNNKEDIVLRENEISKVAGWNGVGQS
jgi:hypothetical protein